MKNLILLLLAFLISCAKPDANLTETYIEEDSDIYLADSLDYYLYLGDSAIISFKNKQQEQKNEFDSVCKKLSLKINQQKQIDNLTTVSLKRPLYNIQKDSFSYSFKNKDTIVYTIVNVDSLHYNIINRDTIIFQVDTLKIRKFKLF